MGQVEGDPAGHARCLTAKLRQLPPQWHNVVVTPKRAFWEAFSTVCVPSLAVWTVLAYLLNSTRKVSYAEGLPIYLFLFLLPCPLIFPTYRRYLRGPQLPKARSRRFHVVCAILYGMVSIICIVAALTAFRHHRGMGDWSPLAMAALWVSYCVDHFYRASKAGSVQPSTGRTF